MIPWLILLLGAYFLGSIPVGFLVARSRGVDIRTQGSGNIGATNVFRTLGKGPGIFVFVCDVLKGFVAVRVAMVVAGHWEMSSGATGTMGIAGIAAAVACILGHNYTCWLGFKGGKGIATTAGVLLGLMPIAVGVVLAVWAILFFATRYVAVASLGAAIALPLVVWALVKSGHAEPAMLWFALLAGALAVWRHQSNIKRLIAGTEPRFVRKKKENS